MYIDWKDLMSTRPSAWPPLIVPAAFFALFTVLAIAAAAGAPGPDAIDADVLAYTRDHAGAMRLSGFAFLAAAIPLAVWTAAAFVAGGPGFAGFWGLLIAGVAVPMLLLALSRPLAVAGLVLAAAAEFATLALVADAAAYALPLARFGGLLWLPAVSLLLPVTRPRRTAEAPA